MGRTASTHRHGARHGTPNRFGIDEGLRGGYLARGPQAAPDPRLVAFSLHFMRQPESTTRSRRAHVGRLPVFGLGMAISLAAVSSDLSARPGAVDGVSASGPSFASVPYILPMEVRLGEYYLQAPGLSPAQASPPASDAVAVQMRGNMFTFEMYTQRSRDDNMARVSWIPEIQGYERRQKSLLSLTWQRRDSFWTVDLRQDFNQRPGTTDGLFVGTGLSYGHTVVSAVSLLFGMKTTGTLDPTRSAMGQVVLDYGKVFFTPGLQLRSRSVIIETFLEMPVYAYDLRARTPDVVDPRDVRANIGIRYNR